MARTFRGVVQWLVPAWLNAGDGEKLLYTFALLIDASAERMRQGLQARFPSLAGPSANTLTGRDRGIQRGRSETDAHYAERLKAWRYPRGHRVRGSAFALLNQVLEYWGAVACWTIDRNGNRHDRTAAGVESYSYSNPWTWDDGASAQWSRFWVGIDASGVLTEQPDWGNPLLWGGAWGTDGYTIGQVGASHEDSRAMRRLMTGRAWRPAGTQPEWLIVSLDGSFPTPGATWEHWSENDGGRQTETRSSDFRYWSFDPAHNNTYAGDPTSFCDDSYLPGGATEGGDSTSFPASSTLPNGATYAGDPTLFSASVQLVDDGDPTT